MTSTEPRRPDRRPLGALYATRLRDHAAHFRTLRDKTPPVRLVLARRDLSAPDSPLAPILQAHLDQHNERFACSRGYLVDKAEHFRGLATAADADPMKAAAARKPLDLAAHDVGVALAYVSPSERGRMGVGGLSGWELLAAIVGAEWEAAGGWEVATLADPLGAIADAVERVADLLPSDSPSP